MSKRQSKRKIRYWIVFEWLGAAILVAILVLVILWYKRDYTALRLEEEAVLFFLGETYSYTPGTEIIYGEDGAYIEGEQADSSMALSDVPLIQQDGKKLILPVNMAYQAGKSDAGVYRVNHFATLSNRDQGAVVLMSEGQEISLARGFLYDGKDMYIFLEPMTITIGDVTYQTEPLSYAKVRYRDSLELYNSADNTFKWLSTGQTEVTAESTRGYTIFLGTDTIKDESMEWILFSAIESMEVIQ